MLTAPVLTVHVPALTHVPAPAPVLVPAAEERDARRKTSTTRVLNLNSLNLKRNTGNKQGESAQKGRSLFFIFLHLRISVYLPSACEHSS